MNTLTKLKTAKVSSFYVPDLLVSINKASSVTLVDFQQSLNWLSDHKRPEIINCSIVKYGHHTALTPAVVKIDYKRIDHC